jgi:O-antigen/teichoic acid export membrane protein
MGDILIKRIDILMVGYFFASEIVGVYNIAVLISGLLVLPLSGFNQLFPPIASELYADGKIDEINSLYVTVTRWIFTISFIMAIGAILYRNELLRLFGPEFAAGSLVLVLFVLAQLFNCLGGANGYLLMMTDHQYVVMANQWLFGIFNVATNYILILEYGFIGAAVATASVLALLNVTKTIELWYLEGLFPYTLGFLKPLVAGVIAIIPMITIQQFVSGIGLLIAGGVLGVVTFLFALYLLGIDKADKEFFREAISNI